MTTEAITIRDLSFRYPDSQRWVLRDINLVVPAGETLLVLGPSGSGKSTLALCLNGLIPHVIDGEFRGEVRVWGQPALALWSATIPIVAERRPQEPSHSTPRPKFVGEVFQDPETQMVMPRADEEIAFGLENLALPRQDMPERIAAALAQVGLQDRQRAWIESLSGGQKQRLALAAVLALRPSILILDEPTANLDPAATQAFYQTLARLKAESGMTMVLIEHRLDAALPLIDRVVALSLSGQVMAQGKPYDVFGDHATVMEAEGVWLPMTCRLMRALAERGWSLPPTLATCGCPLTMDDVETALRLMVGNATSSVVATGGQPVRQPQSLPSTAGLDGADVPIQQPEDPAVAVTNLAFAYAGSPPVLRDVNLTIQRGRFFALVGANGSGKTTLAKHLVGLLRPSSGAVHVLGHDTRRQSKGELARQVGYVFQNPEHQFVTERVADELAYSLRGRFGEDEIARRVGQLLQTFGLVGYEDANPFALSQGQKRRLSVATMVALEQPILILDEPSFGQDQQSTAALMTTLKVLHDAGTTILFITHDMQLVAEYADEVAVMSEGRVIFQGSPRQLFAQPAILQQASLTLPPLADLANRLGAPPLLTVEEWVDWAGRSRAIKTHHQRAPVTP